MLEILLLALIVSWIYWLVAWWWVCDFFGRGSSQDSTYTPAVSILKPVKGIDPEAFENFVSFCEQDYPQFEILFGVSDRSDPVIPVVERLQGELPHRSIRLVVDRATRMNRKASLLDSLAKQARHGTFVVSDSDMRVTPEYLRHVVAPLKEREVGLVTCPYRGEAPRTLAARLEALHTSVGYMPSVIVARRFLGMRFALGATMALRSCDLARLGGFSAIADYLADDYQLGLLIATMGLRVHLSDYVVSNVLGATSFKDQWDREVRWARTISVSRPWQYPGLLFTFSTPLAVAVLLMDGFGIMGWCLLAASLLLRWRVAWCIADRLGNRPVRKWLVWLPVRDMMSALIWCTGGFGRVVTWRGEKFTLRSDGKLEPLPRVCSCIHVTGAPERPKTEAG